MNTPPTSPPQISPSRHRDVGAIHRQLADVSPKAIWEAMRPGGDLWDLQDRVPDNPYG